MANTHGAASLYLLGALDPVRERAFERHLASCRKCLRECEEFGPLVSGLSRLPDHEVAALLGNGTAVDSPTTVEGTGGSARLVVVGLRRKVVAKVSGLEPAVGYRLFAVTFDGQAYEVAEWTGASEPAVLTADLGVPLTEILSFSVKRSDGSVVVVLRFSRGR